MSHAGVPDVTRLATAGRKPGFRAGSVYLVGAGPGHPGLMTTRAREVLAKADVVVYDRLLSPRALGFAPVSAEFVYVGKESGNHTMKQADINALLVARAQDGQMVVRLKGGDPFVFGRGGEEAEACRASGIPFEVVPGVTSAVAVSAYAGIPVTHRGVATSFSVVTGHQCATGQDEEMDWSGLGPMDATLVILMGVGQLETIVRRLKLAGRGGETPVALVRWGTRAHQQTLEGTLDTITRQVRESGFQSPAIIVVGEVVKLRTALSWFEMRPLMGRRILIAADTQEEGRDLASALEELGAETLDVSVEQGTVTNPMRVQQLLNHSTGELLFHDVQSVHGFFACLRLLDMDLRSLAGYRIGAVGESVSWALLQHHIHADFVGTVDNETRMNGAKGTNSGVVTFIGDGVAKEYRICQTSPHTAQLRAMWEASDGDFDLCVATSAEALQFVRQVQHATSPHGHDIPVGFARTVSEAIVLISQFEDEGHKVDAGVNG